MFQKQREKPIRTVDCRNGGAFGFSWIFRSLSCLWVSRAWISFLVRWPPQQILRCELVEIEPSFLFTLHFLYIKTFLPCLGNVYGCPGLLSLPVFAFAQVGTVFLEVAKGAGAHRAPPCYRDRAWVLLL